MPEICRFLGMVIQMYYNDHKPPHFHVIYGDYEEIRIDDQAIVAGKLPPRVRGLVAEWAERHTDELLDEWNRARNLEPLVPIEPLE